jgi:hypothetical protein
VTDVATTRLGDIADLVKGTSPTEKTAPGEYPLVVTADEPRTSSTYQFDGEAVCIPTISSTGHGHASLKRVHYASGQFALANLLVAAIVREDAGLEPRYLHLYLSMFKDELLVPLMQGTANVNMRVSDLAGVSVKYPELDVQRRVIDLVDHADAAVSAVKETAHAVARVYDALIHSVEEKAYPIRPVADVVAKAKAGGTPNRSRPDYFGGDIAWLKSGEVDRDGIDETSEALTEEGLAASSAWVMPASTVVVAMYGQGSTAGSVGYLAEPMSSNQAVLGLVPDPEAIEPRYLFHWMRSRKAALRERIQ